MHLNVIKLKCACSFEEVFHDLRTEKIEIEVQSRRRRRICTVQRLTRATLCPNLVEERGRFAEHIHIIRDGREQVRRVV
jgi:hypothetical protein